MLPFFVPAAAPTPVRQAVVGLLVLAGILSLSLVVGLIGGTGMGSVILSLVLVLLFGYLARQVGHGRQWARILTILLAVVLGLSSAGNIVLGGYLAVVGVVLLIAYVAIVSLLLSAPAGRWFLGS